MKYQIPLCKVFCLLVGVIAIGCKPAANPPAGPNSPSAAKESHPETGPHKGHLIELGEEEYHAELTHEDATKTVTIYILGKDAKTAVPIAEPEIALNLVVDGAPLQAKLAASPQAGDPQGKSSRFVLVDEKVMEALEAPKTTGRLSLTIEGKTFSGNVQHEDHDHGH